MIKSYYQERMSYMEILFKKNLKKKGTFYNYPIHMRRGTYACGMGHMGYHEREIYILYVTPFRPLTTYL